MKAEVLSGALSKRKLISRGEEGRGPFFFFHHSPSSGLYADMIAGVPAAILVQGVILRMNFIHKGGRTDSGLGHDDCGVPIISPGLPTLNPLLCKKYISLMFK